MNNGAPRNLELSSCTIEQFKKLNPPSFKGTPNPTEAESWVMQMEKMFDVLKCTDEQRVSFETFILEGEAKHWWRMTKRIHGERNNLIGWNDFLVIFYEKYFPETVQDQKAADFMSLVQGNMTVSQYEANFTELSRFAPHVVITDVLKAKKFECGLRLNIRSRIFILKLTSYNDVGDREIIAEKDSGKYNQVREGKRKFGEQRGRNPNNKSFRTITNIGQPLVKKCFNIDRCL